MSLNQEFNYFTVFNCPVLNVANATLNSSERSYKNFVLVHCDPGFVINVYPSSTNLTVFCDGTGRWSEANINCQRELLPMTEVIVIKISL